MRRPFLVAALVIAMTGPAAALFGRGGGGRGGMGGNRNQNNQNNQPTPQQQAAQARAKADQLLGDGFAALKAFDTASALEDFSDVLQLAPDDALAHVGLGLARAQKGKFAASETEFSTAMFDARKAKENPVPVVAGQGTGKVFASQPQDPNEEKKAKADAIAAAESDLRLATFDLSVAYSRAAERPRALVLMDRLMSEKKPADEMLVNGLRSLIAMLDDKAQSTIAALPAMLKDLQKEETGLRQVHTPLRRWGVTWMESNEVTRHRMSRETEPLPSALPFLLPDGAVLPEGKKPDAPLVNPLEPIVLAGSDGQPASPGPDSVASGPTPPTTPATQPATSPSASGPAQTSATPTPAPSREPAPTVERTITGAAFAVAPDMLLTLDRLASGAKSLKLQSVDGTSYEATLVTSDEATGLALIKVEAGHFPAFALASTAKPGRVTVPAFTKPGVFGPELQALPGELTFTPGLWSLRVATHPRSAGSPLVNEQGQVVGIVVATRDDPPAKLPVVTSDVIRKFLEGKLPAGAAGGAATNPEQSVLELSAVKEQ